MVHHDNERERATLREEEETLTTTPRTYSSETSTYVSSAAIVEPHRQIAWSAIFAGTVVALVVMMVLNLLGLAIGTLILDPTTGDNLQGLGIGAGIWTLVSTLIALFAGGWVAGRVAGLADRGGSMLHGVVTWGLFSLVAAFMMATAVGGLFGGALGVVGQSLQAAGSNPQLTELIQGEVQQQQEQPGPVVTEGEASEIGAQAAQIGEQASNVVSGAAFWGFAALLLGGILAAIGARMGGKSFEEEDLVTRDRAYKEYRPGRVRHA